MRNARILSIASLVLLYGCATILGGSNQLISVNSNVSGAQVFLNDVQLGVTPLSTSIKRGQEGVLRVQAPSYQPYQIALNKKITSLFWVNIFSGGVFGSTTDYATGAMYEYEPSTYMASLQPAEQTSAERRMWERREGLRAFVLLNNEALVEDLARGSGEHVEALFKLYQIESGQRAQAIGRWRNHYSEARTAAEFAQALVDDVPTPQ
jgi:hypothetical protein